MLELGVKFLISYFIGSLMGAMIVGRLPWRRGYSDQWEVAMRVVPMHCELKACYLRFSSSLSTSARASSEPESCRAWNCRMSQRILRYPATWLTMCCAAATVIGHVWPIYHGFKGGKGAATFIGTLVVLGPALIIEVLLVWVIVVVLTGYVGLAFNGCRDFVATVAWRHPTAGRSAVVHL